MRDRICLKSILSATMLVAICLRQQVVAEAVPANVKQLFATHCGDCHSGDSPEADITLTESEIDWTQTKSHGVKTWQRAYDAIRKGDMPPRDAEQPSHAERAELLNWLRENLTRNLPLTHTSPRRLNRLEYENTIRQLFILPDFQVPNSFPTDDSKHGFDNVAEGLVFSPPLMAEYLAIATNVADEVIPREQAMQKAVPRKFSLGAAGLSDGEGGARIDDRYRLISSRNMASVAAWPSRFEAPASGEYRLTMQLSCYQTDKMTYAKFTEPFGIGVYARPKIDQFYAPFGQLRRLGKFKLKPTRQPQKFSADIELMKGEVFGIRWDDGPAFSDPTVREYSPRFLADRLNRNRRYYAAMLRYGSGPRGINQSDFYDAMVEQMKHDDLDLKDPRLDKLPEKWGGGLSEAPHNWISKFVHEEFRRFGPAVDIVDVKIEGPFRFVEDAETLARKKRKATFLGEQTPDVSDEAYVRSILARFLPQVFRRPVSEETLDRYVASTMNQLRTDQHASIDEAMHFAIRRALVSPSFLYRDNVQSGGKALDKFALASRLSYFLTAQPPDERLMELAQRGELSGDNLRTESQRLIADKSSDNFIRSFTGQWLRSRELVNIMPDPRLLAFFEGDRNILIAETELFFTEMLRENRTMDQFIDPGFSYRNAQLNKIYGGDFKGNEMQRVTFARGGRQGGLLGLASIMMATANGVDTHPVHRGVWLLENILGTPTPPPPDNVPAIAPDTNGTTTIGAQLNAHRADAACARCHDKIDPVGMIMENFDPVGRWREHYPVYTKPKSAKLEKEFYANIGDGTKDGPAIATEVTLADGTQLSNVTDLKQYILEHIDDFSQCVAEKLLTYATGREPGFHDHLEIEKIVESIKKSGNGFQDLVIEVILSDAFAR